MYVYGTLEEVFVHPRSFSLSIKKKEGDSWLGCRVSRQRYTHIRTHAHAHTHAHTRAMGESVGQAHGCIAGGAVATPRGATPRALR
uniref:Uncharacterized protein n=1 Tax=Ixodes ricinus TaxID=34613 RepID=A0A6B0U9J0_IXORI